MVAVHGTGVGLDVLALKCEASGYGVSLQPPGPGQAGLSQRLLRIGFPLPYFDGLITRQFATADSYALQPRIDLEKDNDGKYDERMFKRCACS